VNLAGLRCRAAGLTVQIVGLTTDRPENPSADFQSAVSPISNRQGAGKSQRARTGRRPAECNSAIRQSATLRYKLCRPSRGPSSMSMRRRSSTALPAMGSRAVRSPTKGNEEIEDFVGFVAFCGNLAPASRPGIALGKTADYTDCADTNQMPNPPPTESAPIRVIRGSRIWSFRERDVGPSFGLWPLLSPLAPVQIGL